MPPTANVLAFALACLALIVIPGPSVLFVIGRSLSLGRRGGLLSVVGNELGGLPLVAAVAFGVGALVQHSIIVFTVVKLAGAGYLAYLGIQAIRHRHDHITAEVKTPSSSGRIVLQGFVVGVTNPKSIVFFVAVLPQFVSYQHGSIPGQMIVLGLIFTFVALVCDSTWAILAGVARSWFASSPRRMSRIKGVGGGMMIGLSAILLLAGSEG